MQPEKIILIPPTHEQSTPSFHVQEKLLQPFLAFLKEKGVTPWQPLEKLEKEGSDENRLIEIEIEADTPIESLEGYLQAFLQKEAAKE